MQDQCYNLRLRGIRAEMLSAATSQADSKAILQRMISGGGSQTTKKGKGKAKAAPPPAPSNIRSRLLDKSVLSSARAAPVKGPGRPMISVIKGSAGENGDDQMSGKKGKTGGREMEQDDDEFDYEEDFQDDEEGIAKIDDLADEEETKELEVGLVSPQDGYSRD